MMSNDSAITPDGYDTGDCADFVSQCYYAGGFKEDPAIEVKQATGTCIPMERESCSNLLITQNI